MMPLAQIMWDVDPIAFHIGSFGLHWYSVCWGIGLVLATMIVQRLYKSQKIDEKLFEPLFFYCFFGILIGARLGDCLFYHPEYYLAHPVEIFLPMKQVNGEWKFTGFNGLASHGGTLGLMIALWLYVRKTKINIMRVLDNIAIATPITAAFIRLGNLFNSEIVGEPTTMPWGFIFAHNGEDFARHPGQLYEAIAYLCFFFIGWWLYRRHSQRVGTGFFFGFCLTSIFTFRFLIEFVKDIQVDFESMMLLNMGQLLSLPFIILGLYCMLGGKWARHFGETK